MLQNFSDTQIIGLIILATIIFIFIRRIYRQYRLSKAFSELVHLKKLESLANSNDPVEIVKLPKLAIIATITTGQLVAKLVYEKDRNHYNRIVKGTERLVGVWVTTYPTYHDIGLEQTLYELNRTNLPLTDFTSHILLDKFDQANTLIDAHVTDEELRAILREFVDAIKG